MKPTLTAATVFNHPAFAQVMSLLASAEACAPSPEMADEYQTVIDAFDNAMFNARLRDHELARLASQPATRVA